MSFSGLRPIFTIDRCRHHHPRVALLRRPPHPRELGAAARASFHLVVAWNLIAALCFIALRNIIPLWFTSNAEAIALASELLLYVALYQLMDGIQNVSVGILRGIQDVRILIPIALVSYWLFNLPVGYLLGFVCGMGPRGWCSDSPSA